MKALASSCVAADLADDGGVFKNGVLSRSCAGLNSKPGSYADGNMHRAVWRGNQSPAKPISDSQYVYLPKIFLSASRAGTKTARVKKRLISFPMSPPESPISLAATPVYQVVAIPRIAIGQVSIKVPSSEVTVAPTSNYSAEQGRSASPPDW